MDKVLFDTDIVLDLLLDREPFSEFAAKVFALAETNQIQGFITPVICANLYYILQRNASHENVIEKLSQLLIILDVIAMDRQTVINALISDFKDFEYALQNFAAIHSVSINIILTRNIKDYKKSSLSIMTPENYLSLKSIS
ncbi:MAG: PIN domain-containing protein [Breznakibacter sp.]|jgi:predicted nucleic acid-binding protein|nr:PIN domain-containing protein [Breznakibacter sp.]